jgi:uncharacterized protein
LKELLMALTTTRAKRASLGIGISLLVATAARCAPASRCFLWEASAGKGTVYLLGSIHVGDKSLYPMDPTIKKAFKKADTLVLEVHVTPETEMQSALLAMKKGMYPAGQTLEDNLEKETLCQLRQYLKEQGLSLAMFNSMRPWLLGITLVMREYMQLGLNPKQGIDAHFTARAGERRVLELESVEKQLNILSSGSKEVQDLVLREMLDQIDEAEELMKRLMDAWKTGDADTVDRVLKENMSEDPRMVDMHKKLIDNRNVEMAAKIQEYLETDGTYFVIVGSGHIVGAEGIVQLLKNKKVKVRQLDKTGKT